MTAHMVIAPGEDIDRAWYEAGHAIGFYRERDLWVGWVPGGDPDESLANLQPSVLPLRRWLIPGWKIPLQFYSASAIPPGYALPGWVYGERLESDPVCKECFRLADSQRENLCTEHWLEFWMGRLDGQEDHA
jgi:hypothetical protein